MKTFGLMTKAALMALAVTCAVACSEDDNTSTGGTTVFPQEVTEAVQAGGETTLTFNAAETWNIESDKLWCKFSNGQNTLSGNAGEQKITVTVTDEMQTTTADTASIRLTIGTQTQTIARIIRLGQALTITDANDSAYNAENPAIIAYSNGDASATLSFNGNFNWELKQEGCPEWIEVAEQLPIKGNANTDVQITLNVVKDFWSQVLSDTLKFYMQGTDSYVAVPVSFDGLPQNTIVTDGINGGAFWWNVSGDGKTYWKDGSMAGDGIAETSFPLSFKVLARNNQYQIVRVEQSGSWMNVTDQYSSDITLTDDHMGNITISSFKANTGAERIAYILALPDSVYQDVQQKVENAGGYYDGILLTSDGTDLNSNYEKYTVIAFKQEAANTAEGGFEVLLMGYQPLTCQQGDGGTGLLEVVTSNFGVDASQVYTVNATAGARLTISPMLGLDTWDGSDFANTVGMTFEGGELNKDTWETGMTQDESGFTISLSADQSMILVFRGTDYLNKKALIINVQ